MKYNSSIWKHKLRSRFYNLIPTKLYLSFMPKYLKLFSKKRRACSYKFKIGKNGTIVLYDDKRKFHFIGYRRINRYLFLNGVERKMRSMKKKYCFSFCNIEPGDIVVEIGANVGEFTIMASENAKKVYAFEPDPNCFFCLRENTNLINNIEAIKKGVLNTDKKEIFYLSSEDADSSMIKPKIYEDTILVDFVSLSSWMDSREISEIDFLKIEAEGAEMEVLEGLGNKIDNVKKVSVDGGPERYGEPTSGEARDYLQSKGFKTHMIKDHVYAWRN